MKKEKVTDAIEILKKRYVNNDPEREASIEEERINSRIAQMIYSLRKENKMTQAELAERINTTQSVISRLEDSDYDGHSLTMLNKICMALGHKVNIAIVKNGFNEENNRIHQLEKEIRNLKEIILNGKNEIMQLTQDNQNISNSLNVMQLKVDNIEQWIFGPSGGNVESQYTNIKQPKLRLVQYQ